MNEANKHMVRRQKQSYFDKYIVGQGIDIGCGTSSFHPSAIGYDRLIDPKHDASILPFEDNSFDYVHSSHCLEHVFDPEATLKEWWRVLKPSGHLIVLVPDFGLYEQRQWPSRYNSEHKSKWNLIKLATLISQLPNSEVVEAKRNSDQFDFTPHLYDRTLGLALADVEVIAQKTVSSYIFSSRI